MSQPAADPHRLNGANNADTGLRSVNGRLSAPRVSKLGRTAAQEGQSIAELALLLPVLLLIMAGVFDIGRGLYAYTTVINAAREGARYGAFHPSDSYGIRDRIVQEAEGSGIDLSQSTVIIEWDEIGPGTPIKVTVSYRFQAIVGSMLGGQFISIRGSASMIQY